MDSLHALKQFNQFINWQPGTKIPIDALTGKPIDPHNPANWLTYEQARQRSEYVGRVFTEYDPFFFLDIDNCFDGQQWNQTAQELMTVFNGACVGVSQSGRGLHIYGTCKKPFDHKCKNIKHGLELYTAGRFAALASNCVGDSGFDCTAPLIGTVARYFSTNGSQAPTKPIEWTTGPVVPGVGVSTHDEALRVLLTMKSGRAMFGSDHATPADLYFANEEPLARAYPSRNGVDSYDRSSADMALASHLAFITGGNCELIKELMISSRLNRDKWHNRPAWLNDTILNAVKQCSNWYTPRVMCALPGAALPGASPPVPPPAPGNVSTPPPGVAIMSITEQIEFFKGCVYIRNSDRVFVPDGDVVKPDQFKHDKAGHKFIIDAEGKTTTNAFEAFIGNQAHKFPRVISGVFKPDRPPGEITVDEHGRRSVNVFVPQFGKQIAGDASPFINHIHQLLPFEQDFDIFCDYLAGLVQFPGLKFQWCPVLIGAEGCGKSILYAALKYALGLRYCHQVDPRDLEGKFNGWLEFKLLIMIEEIRTNARREIADILKPWITNTDIPLQAKGQDQRTIQNTANFFLNSNHKDAVLKTITDRRYSVFYAAQQDAEDKKLCGMTNAYFRNLWNWLLNCGGQAFFADWLAKREIKHDLQGTAPDTTSTAEALIESQGMAEHILLEAIESEQPGFRGGLVCVQEAADYLARNGKRMTTKKVGSVLKNIGYIIHPALESYSGKRIKVGDMKRRIMVRKGSLFQNLESADNVRDKWLELKAYALHNINTKKG